jgi:hypothetical protein
VNDHPPSIAERWLARLSFSFFIIAVVLIWTAMRLPADFPGGAWKRAVYLCAAGMSVILGAAGVRARHRSNH